MLSEHVLTGGAACLEMLSAVHPPDGTLVPWGTRESVCSCTLKTEDFDSDPLEAPRPAGVRLCENSAVPHAPELAVLTERPTRIVSMGAEEGERR